MVSEAVGMINKFPPGYFSSCIDLSCKGGYQLHAINLSCFMKVRHIEKTKIHFTDRGIISRRKE
jgi:hypothetical protein